MTHRSKRSNQTSTRAGIGDHPQLAYLRCPNCKSMVVAAEKEKAIEIPKWVFVRDGSRPSKSPSIRATCGRFIKGRVHHQSIPCVGDIVEFPTNPRDPGGLTLKGKVRRILPKSEQGLPAGIEVVLEDGTVATMDIFTPRLLSCIRAAGEISSDNST